jgi:hypothetical protein
MLFRLDLKLMFCLDLKLMLRCQSLLTGNFDNIVIPIAATTMVTDIASLATGTTNSPTK